MIINKYTTDTFYLKDIINIWTDIMSSTKNNHDWPICEFHFYMDCYFVLSVCNGRFMNFNLNASHRKTKKIAHCYRHFKPSVSISTCEMKNKIYEKRSLTHSIIKDITKCNINSSQLHWIFALVFSHFTQRLVQWLHITVLIDFSQSSVNHSGILKRQKKSNRIDVEKNKQTNSNRNEVTCFKEKSVWRGFFKWWFWCVENGMAWQSKRIPQIYKK